LQSSTVRPNDVRIAKAIIGRQVAHLSSLLDDLLDVSRITRGVFVLKKQPVTLQGLLDGAVEAVRPEMDAKGHTLRLEQQAPFLRIDVDPVRITQVITNLLINAAKYTPNGGVIALSTRLEAQHLVIAVRDNGIGIAPDAIDKVFDMFTRIEPGATPSEGGLGIGLALEKGLMALHGGNIEVRSAGRGQGSEFALYFPRALMVDSSVQNSEPHSDAPHLTVSRRILIADDNEDGAETMKLLLASSGHEVHVAHSGAEALAIAQRVHPDVALLDIGMPDMSGYEVAQSIRHEDWGKGITLIAATGWGQQSDKRRALEAGFDEHLTKPIDPTRLGTLLERR
jgi:CheY-like chemotaxis protein